VTNRERFLAVCRGEQPDYIPIFGFPGAPGMGGGCQTETMKRLIEKGMPEWVGAEYQIYSSDPVPSWQRYWGTTSPIYAHFSLAKAAKGLKWERHEENGWEIYECETGARTRQVLDNDNIYIMPDFQAYHVSDRKSWEYYRERTAPSGARTMAEIEPEITAFNPGDYPVVMSVPGTWGPIRDLMGPERACTIMYDDPDLVREILRTTMDDFEKYTVPVIERIQPDIIQGWEDCCYNHGLLISPTQFREFCGPYYRRLAQLGRDCTTPMVTIDCDGHVMELVEILAECGLNSLFPFEAKGNNDLLALRKRYPHFILMGWLEKEVVNEGNEHLIEPEIMSKVPPLLKTGRYFPNGDHGLQPLVDFKGLCKFMTLLHDVTNNPEGEFPRIR
jgi:hypothetical protein